MTHTVN